MELELKALIAFFALMFAVLVSTLYVQRLKTQERAEMFTACIQQADKAPVLETSFAGHVEACRKVLEEKP